MSKRSILVKNVTVQDNLSDIRRKIEKLKYIKTF